MKIGFIGLGKLGLKTAEYFSDFYKVYGFDINQNIKSDKIKIVDYINDLSICDIIYITVSTPHEQKYDGNDIVSNLEKKDFIYDNVINVLEQLNHIKNIDKKIIILISTVLPLTFREKILPIIKYEIVYNPYLIAMNTVEEDLKNPEMIMLGYQDKNKKIKKIKSIYKNISNVPFFAEGSFEEIECLKVFYNTMISNKINTVNMIMDIAHHIGANANKICQYLSMSTKRIVSDKYLTPGLGDGGPCHPRDNIALSFLSQKIELNYDFFNNITITRERQAENLANFIISIYEKEKLPLIINGLSYKEKSNISDGSYVNLILSFLRNKNIKFEVIDPYLAPIKLKKQKFLVFLAHKKFYFKIKKQSVIIDIWKKFDKNNKDYKIYHY
jgi:UDPglucose 6-dehydrogenase